MAKRAILKVITLVLAFPWILVARIAEYLNLWRLNDVVAKCFSAIDSTKYDIPQSFVMVLVTAEDKRSAMHPGIDPIAIIRTLYVMCVKRRLQGASTIEQQFVRVVTGRYQRNFGRKFIEQVLAVTVARHRSKHQIAAAYLSIAFYGSGLYGIKALKNKCGHPLNASRLVDIVEMVSRLKYPEPVIPTESWRVKVLYRKEYIIARLPMRQDAEVCRTGMPLIALSSGAGCDTLVS